ncbi:hypothetical protein B0H10DRAFT_2039748 [Mycena sp. CBHHK59/15]|nr:hypothetical protein B0H10DRAFT_2039748 [Mycena sp. CBHHK59/15]
MSLEERKQWLCDDPLIDAESVEGTQVWCKGCNKAIQLGNPSFYTQNWDSHRQVVYHILA